MSEFLFTYRSAKNYTPGSTDVMAAWNAWFESMGEHVVDRGNPVFERTILGNVATDTELGGYSLISADDLDAAVALAKGCPTLTAGGAVEIGVITHLNVGTRLIGDTQPERTAATTR